MKPHNLKNYALVYLVGFAVLASLGSYFGLVTKLHQFAVGYWGMFAVLFGLRYLENRMHR